MVNQTMRLGRVFGLEISFHWSLILIYFLIAWTMATTVLPAAAPGSTTLAYWISGLAGSAVFYLCLLAHELSHALVARGKGVRVAGITLWLFGGVTQLDGDPPSAASQALITVVGPLTSLVLGGVGFGLVAGLSALGAPALVTNLVTWLAILNLILGVFNLVPAFPLDGGRLLGAAIWGLTGSKRRGIRGAVRVGRVFAGLVILGGLLEAVSGDLLSGVWLAFIGMFLFTAGGAEERQSEVLSALARVPVSAAMVGPVPSVPDWLTVEQLLGGAATHRFAIYHLHDPNGQPTGFVRLADLPTPGVAHNGERLRDFALPYAAFAVAGPGEDLDSVIRRAGASLDRGLLVVDAGQLVGVLSTGDIARAAAFRSAARQPL